MRARLIVPGIALAVLGLLAACGQKGPLVLPSRKPASVAAPAAAAPLPAPDVPATTPAPGHKSDDKSDDSSTAPKP